MRTILILLPIALAGCAGHGVDAPSLAPRAVERTSIPFPDAASEPVQPATPALAGRIAAILSDAEAGHTRFESERRAAGPAIARARGAKEGSEAWIAAQTSLSAVQAAQAPVRAAAGAIDALRDDPAFAGEADRAAIEAAAARIAALRDAEEAALRPPA